MAVHAFLCFVYGFFFYMIVCSSCMQIEDEALPILALQRVWRMYILNDFIPSFVSSPHETLKTRKPRTYFYDSSRSFFAISSVHRQISWHQSPGDHFIRIHTWHGFIQWVEDDTSRDSWTSSHWAGQSYSAEWSRCYCWTRRSWSSKCLVRVTA